MTNSSEKTMTERVKEHAEGAVSDAKDKVGRKAKAEAETARDTVADQVQKHADAADAAAAEFDPESVQAKAIEQVAARIDDLADQLRNTDIDRLARSLGDTAQRNPLLFVAGAALAGFAATRFLKARDPRHRTAHDYDDPWLDNGARGYSTPASSGRLTQDLTSRGAA